MAVGKPVVVNGMTESLSEDDKSEIMRNAVGQGGKEWRDVDEEGGDVKGAQAHKRAPKQRVGAAGVDDRERNDHSS